jgi:hypothetical protein
VPSGTAYAAYAVGFLPIPLPIVDFFGKISFGGSKFDKTFSAPQLSGTSSHQGLGIRVGLGGTGTLWHRGRFAASMGYWSVRTPTVTN